MLTIERLIQEVIEENRKESETPYSLCKCDEPLEEDNMKAPENKSLATQPWETGLTRGKANPIFKNGEYWETGVTRGKANPIAELKLVSVLRHQYPLSSSSSS
jgi:hypothetical protein